jgi:hypothetical protein
MDQAIPATQITNFHESALSQFNDCMMRRSVQVIENEIVVVSPPDAYRQRFNTLAMFDISVAGQHFQEILCIHGLSPRLMA